MAKKKPSSRVNIYIPDELLPLAREIENFSAFVQIALEQAPDIMTWAILHKANPKKYHARAKMKDVIDEFNEKYPQDPLTQKRLNKWQTNSQKLPKALL